MILDFIKIRGRKDAYEHRVFRNIEPFLRKSRQVSNTLSDIGRRERGASSRVWFCESRRAAYMCIPPGYFSAEASPKIFESRRNPPERRAHAIAFQDFLAEKKESFLKELGIARPPIRAKPQNPFEDVLSFPGSR